MQRLGYVPALDGLRAVAIVCVVASHAFGWPHGGASGVDLFFVLSGFLITTLLLEEHAEHGQVSLRNFYVRRVRRLVPALLFMLACFLVIGAAKGVGGWAARSVIEGGFYTGNFVMAFHLGTVTRGNPVGPLWSLATEEQFYLLWPLALLLVMRRQRAGDLIARITIAALMLPFFLYLLGANNDRLEFAPDTRAGELLVGCTIAFAFRNGATSSPFVGLLGIAGFLGCVYLGLAWQFEIPLVAMFAACLVLSIANNQSTPLNRLLAIPPLTFIGRISYSLYLWNLLVLWAFGWRWPVLAVAVATGTAWFSYRFVEEPFRRRRLTTNLWRYRTGSGVPGLVRPSDV